VAGNGSFNSYRAALDFVHTTLAPRRYVETGVSQGGSMALLLPGTRAVGIDPEPKVDRPIPRSASIYPMPSDEFFERHDLSALLGGPADVAFIDGMHLFEYALRDLINIERHCSSGSVVLVHDCYPQDEVTAARERTTRRWSGDIWKLILCLREYRPELRLATLDVAPTGLGVITGLDPSSRVLSERYDEICERFVPLAYGVLDQGKPEALARVPGDAGTLAELLPDRPFRAHGRRALLAARNARDRRRLARRFRRRLVRRARRARRRIRRRAGAGSGS
jgi:Methyltransferase domain